MKKFLLALFLILGLGTAIFYAQAAEQITSYDAVIKVDQAGRINVTENITYDFGSLNKHGIYRDIPISYSKAIIFNHNLKLSDVSVTDEGGRIYKFELTNSSSFLRIKVGDPASLITGQHFYKIRYTVERAVVYQLSYDEINWNVIGTGWGVPILKSTTSVQLPVGTDTDRVSFECFTGLEGSTTPCWQASKNSFGFYVNQNTLSPHAGYTIRLRLPKGVLVEPSIISKIGYFISDNWVLALPIITFIILFILWYKRGRDPKNTGTIIPQYDVPDDLSPAEVGTIIDGKVDNYDVSSDIIGLAVRGYLKINRLENKGLLHTGVDYELTPLKPADDLPNTFERTLFAGLFKDGLAGGSVKLSSLKTKFYKVLADVKTQLYEAVTTKGYFVQNPSKVRNKFMSVGIGVLFFTVFIVVKTQEYFTLLTLISIGLSGVLIILFGLIMPALTIKGLATKQYILGLKEYLTVVEKDRLAFHNAPEKNPKVFEKLLPFAMALKVEQAWAQQFAGVYSEPPSWYVGSPGVNFSYMVLASDMGLFKNTSSSTLAAAPMGSHGSGGGGFSGGGFGGGGGGSW